MAARSLVPRTVVALALAPLVTAASAFAERSTPLQLTHSTRAAGDYFGDAVVVQGDTIVIGAPFDDVGANGAQGSAHVYRWTGSGWSFEATLTASDGAADDFFGCAVALSGDTVLVGAQGVDVGVNSGQGAAYVFVRSGVTWTQQAKLLAADGATGDDFGYTVALDGNSAVVGAPFDTVNALASQGSAYVFERIGSTWSQQAQLLGVNASASDLFGYAVAISGDSVLIGARSDDVGANANQGSAYVFTRSGASWELQTQLLPSDGATFDLFGSAVALHGDTALVGSMFDDVGANANQGSAYVFLRSGTTWSQQAQLVASDGAASDQFGFSVALTEDTALVGSLLDDIGANADQGSAYAFHRSGSTWTQRAKLAATDGAAADRLGQRVALFGDTAVIGAPTDDIDADVDAGSAWIFSRVEGYWIEADSQAAAADGEPGDYFGQSVAISGDTALVGALYDNDAGSAYFLVRSGANWVQQAQVLNPESPLDQPEFGTSVALDGDTALVGDPDDGSSGPFDHGSVYVFVRSGATWTQQARLVPPLFGDFGRFGSSVAISGNTAVVGTVNYHTVFVFVRSGSTWTQQAALTLSGDNAFARLGASVAIEGDTIVAGAPDDSEGFLENTGAAYVFTRTGTVWTQQARLVAADAEQDDHLGADVAVSGDTLVVSCPSKFIQAGTFGAAYVFVRTGTTWAQQARVHRQGTNLNAPVAINGDVFAVKSTTGFPYYGETLVFVRSGTSWSQSAVLTDAIPQSGFGRAVAVSGRTLLVSTLEPNDEGTVYSFDVAAPDFSIAHNDTANVTHPTLAAAVAASQWGDQITATSAAFRDITTIDTEYRRLGLVSRGPLRTNHGSQITLDSSSYLERDWGTPIEIYGALRVPGGSDADILANAGFLLGAGGELRVHSGGSLTIGANAARLEGATFLEPDTALTCAGGPLTLTGSLIAAADCAIAAGDGLTNIGSMTFSDGAAAVVGPVINRDSIIIGRDVATTFADDFTNYGVVQASIDSVVTFQGAFSGDGFVTGSGSVIVEGDLSPGASPGQLSFDGNLTLGALSNTIVEIGGLTPGSEFDRIVVGGTLTRGGTLTIELINGFTPAPGDSFEFIAADDVLGAFGSVELLGAPPGVVFSLEQATNGITLHAHEPADRALAVIYTKIPGHPTASVPGVRDAAGLPTQSDFRAMDNLRVSPDGSLWALAARSQLGANLENVLLLGSGTTGTALAQEGQPIPSGAPDEVFDFFSSGLGAFNTLNDFAYAARARGGVASVFQKVIVWDGATQSIAFQMGDPYFGLQDLLPNPSGDETVGNSVGSIHILDDGTIGSHDAIPLNLHSSRRPVLTYDRTMFQQSGVTTVTALGGIGVTLWNTIDNNEFYTTPDGARWLAEGRVTAAPTNPRVLVLDGAAVLQEGQPVAISGPLLGDISQNSLLASGDWLSRGRDNSGVTAAAPDWAVRNGALIARSGTPTHLGAADNWGDTLYAVAGNRLGDYVVAGNSTGPAASNDVIVLNGAEVILREGDPVDVDGNGLFDDNAFVGRGDDTLAFMPSSLMHLTDDRELFAVIYLRDGNGNDLNSNPIFGFPNAFIRLTIAPVTPPCPGERGDANCDGTVDFFDIDPFLLALFDPATYASLHCNASTCAVDVDCSGVVDFFDIDPFLTCVFSGCAACP